MGYWNFWTLLSLITLFFQNSVQQGCFITNCNGINLLQNITNQKVSEDEILRIQLIDYYQGQQFEHKLQIYDGHFDMAATFKTHQFIYISDPYQIQSSQRISADIFSEHIQPFPRSTLFIQDIHTGDQFFYFVDRNFVLRKFDAFDYIEGVTTELIAVQLDKRYVNYQCSDLQQVPMGGASLNLLLFCSSRVTQYNETHVNSSKHHNGLLDDDQILIEVTVLISLPDDNSSVSIKYLQFYHNQNPIIERRQGLEILQIQTIYASNVSYNQLIFATNTVSSIQTKLQFSNYGVLFGLNYSLFDEIPDNGTLFYDVEDQPPIEMLCKLRFFDSEHGNYRNQVIDFQLIDEATGLLAILVADSGVHLIDPYAEKNLADGSFCRNQRYSTYIKIEGIALYINDQMPNYLYVANSLPPSVTEIDITDILNPFIFKVYSNWDDCQSFVGLSTVAVNNNYVIHSLVDITTQEQVLRVYCRNCNQKALSKYHIILPAQSQPNYFVFPNMYIDTIWFRDEQRVNITSLVEPTLVMNGTQKELLQSYKYVPLMAVIISTAHPSCIITMEFNITFVSGDDFSIQPIGQFKPIDVFYNCGEKNFNYLATDYYNGPNFKLMATNNSCGGKTCYFEFVNQKYESLVTSNLTAFNCRKNFLVVPDTKLDSPYTPVLICIDFDVGAIKQYEFNIGTYDIEPDPKSEVFIPDGNIVDACMDESQQLLLVVTWLDWPWLDYSYQLHVYEVGQILVWRNSNPIFDFSHPSIQQFTYNSVSHKGMLVTTVQDNSHQILYFTLGLDSRIMTYIYNNFIPVSNDSVLVHTAISDLGFVYMLFGNNTLLPFEVFTIGAPQSKDLINFIQQKPYDFNETIHTFDIIKNLYLVTYSGNQTITVYELVNNICITFKMTLPFYEEFHNFTFAWDSMGPNVRFNAVTKNYVDDQLSVVMFSGDYHGRDYSAVQFLYLLATNRHNAFTLTKDLTETFAKGSYIGTHLMDYYGEAIVSVLNMTHLQIFEVSYLNYLQLQNNQQLTDSLVEQCSQMTIKTNSSGQMQDQAFHVETIYVAPFTLFSSNYINGSNTNATITFNLVSQNQGLAITPSIPERDNITFNTNSIQILTDTIIDGFNINYKINCSYIDYTGESKDCSQGIVDESTTEPYNFYIEFVTSKRRVLKSFQLGDYYFMFDTAGWLNVLTIKDYIYNLDLFDGFAMEPVTQFLYIDSFQAIHLGYMDMFPIKLQNSDQTSNWLMTYQGLIAGVRTISFALISIPKAVTQRQVNGHRKILNQINKNQIDPQINITVFKGGIQNSYLALDIDITEFQFQSNSFDTKAIIAYDNPGSYSNQLTVYNLSFSLDHLTVIPMQGKSLCAKEIQMNTFMANQIMIIPSTQIAVVTVEDDGIFFYDLVTQQVLKQISLIDFNQFYSQNVRSWKKFQVFSSVGDFPFVIHVLTNYGVFIFYFQSELTDRESIMSDPLTMLTPVNSRVIRQYFDSYNYEIAANEWGYAYLVKSFTSGKNFEVYLGAVSFYSSANSRVYKMIMVSSNEECNSLNLEATKEIEDELPVNFLCGTQLFMVNICMKSHMKFTFTNYSDVGQQATKYFKYDQGIMGFNQYNITVQGANGFTSRSSDISVRYQRLPDSNLNGVQLGLIVAIGITVLGLIYLYNWKCNITVPSPSSQQIISEGTDTTIGRMSSKQNRSNIKTYRRIKKLYSQGLDLQEGNPSQAFIDFDSAATRNRSSNKQSVLKPDAKEAKQE